MLHLILGGAGSGKSTKLTEHIAADIENGRRAWLIIPEQQANLSERTMLPRLPMSAGLTFTIAGFTRLYREVAAQYGGLRPTPGKSLCSLVMWQNLHELHPLLVEYGSDNTRTDTHLTELLLATVDELRANAITPTMLENAAAKLPAGAPLKAKLSDLALLQAAYTNGMSECLDGGSEDDIAALAGLLDQHDFFAGSNVYIDSFTDFTAEEYAVLRHILRQADRVTMTLCCEGMQSQSPAFATTEQTVRRLARLCEDAGVPMTHEVLTQNRRTARHELAVLEQDLWNFSRKKEDIVPIPPEERGAITLLRCTNVYAEAQATALHILDLVHHGVRYGDIAVMVRDGEIYRGVLDAAFERFGIPFYFSEKTALTEKPLLRLMLSALHAIVYSFQASDILTMLKTGLCPVTTHDLDLFEQYVTTWSINGSAFTAPVWTRNPDGYTERLSERGNEILQAANRVREAIMTPLLRLYTAISQKAKLPHLCAALYDFLQEMHVGECCAALAERELQAGYLKQAGETVRIYDVVRTTLTQISAAMPHMELSASEFATVLRMVFEQTEIASVPSLHDSVTVGSAATLRVENIAVAFVLGVNEGEFPAAAVDSGLLCEAERKQLEDCGIHFNTTGQTRQSDELLFIWRAMTKPSERLFVSTQQFDTDGRQKAPSVAYRRLLYLFPYLKDTVRTFDLSMLPTSPVLSPASTDTDAPAAPAAPSPISMSRFFGDTLYLTQSRIQSFVQCPYSFYCNYILSLRERTVARIDYADSGTFLHYVLEHFLKQCLDSDGQFLAPEDEEIEPLASDIVNTYLNTYLSYAANELRILHIFRRLHALTLMLLRDIVNELRHSRFCPAYFELEIGGRSPDAAPYYEILLDGGRRIILGGKVDRVDVFRRDDAVYLRVIDYKSGSKEFSIADIKKGLNLQLLIYLFSLCRADNVHPAGVMYVATTTEKGMSKPERTGLLLSDPDILAAMNDELNPTYLAGVNADKLAPGAKGVASAQELQQLEQDITTTLRDIANEMLRGHAPRTPSEDACRFCSMRGGCPDAIKARNY